MKKNVGKMIFENIGGSFQFRARKAEDLRKILTLDSTAWAALCVPVASLNGDPAFFKALDDDGNGMVRVDEVKAAIRWLDEVLCDIKVLDQIDEKLPSEAINKECADGKVLSEYIDAHAKELLNEAKELELSQIRSKLAAVTSGALTGNGILPRKAVNDPAALAVYDSVTAAFKCADALTLDVLNKFVAEATSFIEWSKTTEKPLFRNDDPVKYFDCYRSLAGKIDEYFRFCDLICADSAHAARFALDADKLPPLDLQDAAAVEDLLKKSPLCKPECNGVLELNNITNPFYQKQAAEFAGLFKVEKLSSEEWAAIKNDIAPYKGYLEKAQGAAAGAMGCEKLEKYLSGNGLPLLKALFEEDKALGGVVDSLRKLERLLLYSRYLVEFVNNFVCFETFFDPERISMLQAGRLVMDGKSYTLAVWIDDVAAHKKIAVRSNLCLLYLEVVSSGKNSRVRKLAVAVTGGSLNRIYVGKPAFFVDNDNITYHGKIVDMVEGPISFGQTLSAPFRRISDAIGNKLQKLTDFSNTEKELTQAIDQGKLPPTQTTPPAATNPPLTQRFLNQGSLMLLAGGLSVAALGAGISFVIKSISNAITSISALPFYVVLIWIVVFLGIFLVPMSIFAFLRLRKRNLTLFLEAGGWAVNLPMRLNIQVSGIFTHSTKYPEKAAFKIVRLPGSRRIRLFVILCVIVLLLAAGAYCHLKFLA